VAGEFQTLWEIQFNCETTFGVTGPLLFLQQINITVGS
jgi:hypothetical protein